jgi:hypothetical protein
MITAVPKPEEPVSHHLHFKNTFSLSAHPRSKLLCTDEHNSDIVGYAEKLWLTGIDE